MWNWILNNLSAVVLFVLFILALAYVAWLRFRMAVSKARFAFVTLAALVTCFSMGMSLISTPIPLQIINVILSQVGWPTLPTPMEGVVSWIIGGGLTALVMVLIVRFASKAIVHWEGPVTLTVNDLAKERHDNHLWLLAMAEIARLARWEPDRLASETAIRWEQKLSPAPIAPRWHDFARELFEATFSEAVFGPRAWRDRFNVLTGEIYVSCTNSADTMPLHVFVFDNNPSDAELIRHLEAYVADGASLNSSKVYALFDAETNEAMRTLVWSGLTIEVWPRQALLRRGLKLTGYARELILRFDRETLGGTKATLKDTFVEAHVARPEKDERRKLTEILAHWLMDTRRQHLAITGEYGQGKSTAMLAFCVSWARRYLENGAPNERIPLLIELRGQNPAEGDILPAWAARHTIPPKQIANLIKAGEAVVIFEGFDELRNAGREYDRHEHFNRLWAKAYPGTKIIFTGRPNFFLDDTERNRTLRSDAMRAAAGDAFTEVWQMSRLTEPEIQIVLNGFGGGLGQSVLAATKEHPSFLDIVSRPSMLPVVATIWDEIEQLRKSGHSLTSGVLIEKYLDASYRRKEVEIEKAEYSDDVQGVSNYLLLPREVREAFTMLVVWYMASKDARNTISRADFNNVIGSTMDDILAAYQAQGANPITTAKIRQFEEQFRHESKADRLERVCNEVASAALFVSDPAGGSGNLRLPHKQFYEFLIAKASWEMTSCNKHYELGVYQRINKDKYLPMLTEDQSILFFSEFIGNNFAQFRGVVSLISFPYMLLDKIAMGEVDNISVSCGTGVIKFTKSFTRLVVKTAAAASILMSVLFIKIILEYVLSISVYVGAIFIHGGAAVVFLIPLTLSIIGIISISQRTKLQVFRRVVAFKLGRVSKLKSEWECFLILIGSAHSVILQRARAEREREAAHNALLSSSP